MIGCLGRPWACGNAEHDDKVTMSQHTPHRLRARKPGEREEGPKARQIPFNSILYEDIRLPPHCPGSIS